MSEVIRQLFFSSGYKTKGVHIHENHIRPLFYLAAQRISNTRAFARRWIRVFLKLVPYMVWSHKSVFSMFDIVLYLDSYKQGISATESDPARALIFFDAEDAALASKEFLTICEEWLDVAFSHSTSETLGLIQVNDSNLGVHDIRRSSNLFCVAGPIFRSHGALFKVCTRLINIVCNHQLP